MKNMKQDTWSAAQYIKFEKERNRPITDLIAQIPANKANKAIDIGCGPGNSTELLAAHFPKATSISGIDSSADMVKAAKIRMPDIHFEVADISSWEDENLYDIIFANAALQWVPDHKALFPSLVQKLNKNGTLAVQMPDNLNEPTHVLMRKIASDNAWSEKLKDGSKRTERESADWYYQLLKNKVSTLNIWRTTYFHPLSGGHEAIVEWLKGTGLRPFLAPLDQAEQSAFLNKYVAEIAKVYPIYDDGSVLLPYPRLFIVATR